MSVLDVKVDNNAICRLAEKLNSEDLLLRNRTIKKLHLLIERSAAVNDDLLSEINLLRLWKGLHYCLLVTEDVKLQEELTDHFAGLGSCFESPELSARFVSAFLKVEMNEWSLLDSQKLPRFVKLSRKVLTNALQFQQDPVVGERNVVFLNTIERLFRENKESINSFITTIATVLSDESKNVPEVTGFQLKKFIESLQSNCRILMVENASNPRQPAENIPIHNPDANSKISSPEKRKHESLIDTCLLAEETKKAKLEETTRKLNDDDSVNEDLEVNIWIPNKKYNGPMKQVAAKHFTLEEKQCRTVSPKRPQAKSLLSTPKSDPTALKKRVSFALNRNKSQNYEDSLNLTPRFDPNRKPIKGVLKLSPGYPEIHQKSNLFKKRKNLKRLKATRFL